MPSLGELFDKLGRDAGLSTRDRLALRTKGNNLDAIETTMGSTTQPSFRKIIADETQFGLIPGETCRIGTATDQTIANNTETRLTNADSLNTITGKSYSFGIPVDLANGEIQLSNFESPSIFLIGCFVVWDANSTGDRSVKLYSSDSLSYIDEHPPGGGSFPTHSPVWTWRVSGYKADDLNLRVLQTSGGDLDIDFWHFWAKRIR